MHKAPTSRGLGEFGMQTLPMFPGRLFPRGRIHDPQVTMEVVLTYRNWSEALDTTNIKFQKRLYMDELWNIICDVYKQQPISYLHKTKLFHFILLKNQLNGDTLDDIRALHLNAYSISYSKINCVRAHPFMRALASLTNTLNIWKWNFQSFIRKMIEDNYEILYIGQW